MLVRDYALTEIVDLDGEKIFENATVTNCIPFVEKREPIEKVWISKVDEGKQISKRYARTIGELMPDEKTLVWKTSNDENVLARYKDLHTLGDYCYISVGMVLNADEKTNKGAFPKDDLISERKDKIHCREYIEAKDIGRYVVNRVRYLEYGTKRCPGLLRRATFPELYEHPKLMINRLGRIQVIYDVDALLHSDSMFSAVPWFSLKGVENKSIDGSVMKFSSMTRDKMERLSNSVDLKCLLAILNSRYGLLLLNEIRGGDYHIYPDHLRNFPIPDADAKQQRQVSDNVDRILAAKKKDPDADTSALESQIDQLVYKLYGLTEEEIAVVEGRGNAEEGGGGAAEVAKRTRRARRSGPESRAVSAAGDDDEELE